MHAERGERLGGGAVDPSARGHADLERRQLGRPRDGRRRLAQALEAAGRRGGVQRKAVPAVALLDGAPERRLRVAADHDGRRRLLDGLGMRLDALEGGEAAAIGGRGLRPDGADRREVLVGDAAALLERGAEGAELRLEIAHADAEDEAAIRHDVERGQLLREDQRIALGQDDDPRAEADPARVRGQEGERDDGVDDAIAGRRAARAAPGDRAARRARRPRATRSRPSRRRARRGPRRPDTSRGRSSSRTGRT